MVQPTHVPTFMTSPIHKIQFSSVFLNLNVESPSPSLEIKNSSSNVLIGLIWLYPVMQMTNVLSLVTTVVLQLTVLELHQSRCKVACQLQQLEGNSVSSDKHVLPPVLHLWTSNVVNNLITLLTVRICTTLQPIAAQMQHSQVWTITSSSVWTVWTVVLP